MNGRSSVIRENEIETLIEQMRKLQYKVSERQRRIKTRGLYPRGWCRSLDSIRLTAERLLPLLDKHKIGNPNIVLWQYLAHKVSAQFSPSHLAQNPARKYGKACTAQSPPKFTTLCKTSTTPHKKTAAANQARATGKRLDHLHPADIPGEAIEPFCDRISQLHLLDHHRTVNHQLLHEKFHRCEAFTMQGLPRPPIQEGQCSTERFRYPWDFH